jgi:hypothetical protein
MLSSLGVIVARWGILMKFHCHREGWPACLLLLMLSVFAALPVGATPDIYSRAELETEAVRLRNAVIRLYEIGIKPSLTAEEKRALGEFEFAFPLPRPGDVLMNFAASTDGRFVIMPLASLKALEDLATAYAWRYERRQPLRAIDLYFAMLRYRDQKDFPGGKAPTILDALDVPKDAYAIDKKVDTLSLSLRNEAYAFIIAHELGHIRFKHKPLAAISPVQSEKDEAEADRFALDIFGRTKTPALGAVFFFQAQIYSLQHRHEFASEAEWAKHVRTVMTHPLSTERIRAMAAFMGGALAQSRPGEAALWIDIAAKLHGLIGTMEDEELARCVVKLAKLADFATLKPGSGDAQTDIMTACRS